MIAGILEVIGGCAKAMVYAVAGIGLVISSVHIGLTVLGSAKKRRFYGR